MMNHRGFVLTLTLLSIIMLIAGSLGTRAPNARAVEQGTITVTKTWAEGQEPNEVVEVCFVVTQDADGTEVLGEACTSDETYTVSFGPSGPPLATGLTYYVWEDVGAGWTVAGDNPVEVAIPDTTGQAEVAFENQRAAGMATITIHKAACPETAGDLFGRCHDNREGDIRFSVDGKRVVTDDDGVATAEVASGQVKITEAAADFSAFATAGAAYAYCAVQPSGRDVLYDELADHRSITIEVPAGASVVCDWYNLTGAPTATGKLEIHKRVCPNGEPTGDIFEECHSNPPQQPVGFSLDGSTAKFVDDQGNVVFTGLSDATHAIQEIEGPPLAYVRLAIWCSVQGTEQAPLQVQPDGPNFQVPVGQGQHVICDVYNIPLDLSGQTATPPPPPTPTPPAPPPPTATSTDVPPTATSTPTPIPPTATATPVEGRPIRIQAGTCDDLSNQPRFNLTDLTSQSNGVQGSNRATVVEASYTLVNVSLDDLLASDFAISVPASGEEAREIVACGEIGGPFRSDGSIVVGLRELEGSGLTGIAYLLADPGNPGRTRVSAFLAPGLAEEDPTLKPLSDNSVVIHSIVDNGPIAPEFQEGYEITIFGSGRVEIVITPPGASEALGDERTAEQERRALDLTDEELTDLLTELQDIGFFGLTPEDELSGDDQVVGGPTSLLNVSLVDGNWTINGNGLSQDEAATLQQAQQIVASAVGGVELP